MSVRPRDRDGARGIPEGIRRRPRALLLVALALIPLGCPEATEQAEEARAAALAALERGDRSAADAAIRDLQGSLPEGADSLIEVAGLRVRAGDAPQASWLLEEGLQRHPERHDLRLALARVALLLGNATMAARVAGEVPPDAAQHADALILRAQAELQLGDLETALETLQETERAHPEEARARLVRVATLLSERRLEEARQDIDAVLASEAADADVRRSLVITLAQIEAREGDPGAAIARIEGWLEESPGDALAWQVLAQLVAEQEGSAAAVARLEEALAREESPLELHLLQARLHAQADEPEEAEAALRAWAATPALPGASLPLARFLAESERASDAAAVLEDALARYPDEPSLLLPLVEALLGADRLAEARDAARRFRAATYRGDPRADYLDARLALAQGDASRAARELLELAPRLDRAATQFWLGRALELSGDEDGARRRYALAQLRDRAWPAPALAQARIALRRGDWRDLARQGAALVRLAPRRFEGWAAVVEAAISLGHAPAAEEAARRAAERFAGEPRAAILMAKALRAQGRHDEALLTLTVAEQSAELRAERALTLGMAGRIDEGLAEIREGLHERGEAAPLRAAEAALRFAKGAAAEGSQATDRALALDPEDPAPLRVRCRFRVATGDFAGARADCGRYGLVRPGDPEVHFLLGLALDGLGEIEAALAAYRRAAELDPADPRPRNNLAELLSQQGDLLAALAAAQEAYRLDEDDPYVLDTLGHLYARAGHPSRAVALLERAHTALPKSGEVSLHLALAYRDVGREDEARQLLLALRDGTAATAAEEGLRARAREALGTLPGKTAATLP